MTQHLAATTSLFLQYVTRCSHSRTMPRKSTHKLSKTALSTPFSCDPDVPNKFQIYPARFHHHGWCIAMSPLSKQHYLLGDAESVQRHESSSDTRSDKDSSPAALIQVPSSTPSSRKTTLVPQSTHGTLSAAQSLFLLSFVSLGCAGCLTAGLVSLSLC